MSIKHYHCTACGTSLCGAPIPEKDREFFGGQTHWSRVISIFDLDKDRTMKWKCPDCGYEWSRE